MGRIVWDDGRHWTDYTLAPDGGVIAKNDDGLTNYLCWDMFRAFIRILNSKGFVDLENDDLRPYLDRAVCVKCERETECPTWHPEL